MIIDKEQLISLLKEKTEFERDKVEDQLAELVTRIHKATTEGKTFEIEGFGAFQLEDDDLHFEPCNTLETEINNKYAGMKPIELIGAFKEPDGDEVPVIEESMSNDKDKVWAFDKEAEEPSQVPEAETEEEQPDKEPVEPDEEPEPIASDDEPEKVLEKMLSSMEDEPATAGIPVDEGESQIEEKESAVEDHPSKEKDIASRLLIAAIVVIAIGVSGWVAYDTGLIANNDSSGSNQQAGVAAVQQNENTQPETAPDDPSPSSVADISSEPEQELPVGTQQESPPEEETEQQATFGLKGEVNESISSGYTIVVHSLRRIEEAESRRENLQEAGYRALISEASVQGTTYFRVGLGQFETIGDAQQAVSDIPEPFQSTGAHFIKRIQ